MKRIFAPLLLLASAVAFAPADEISYSADVSGFAQIAQPFLQEHCVKCHGPEKQKAKLRLDTLENQFTNPAVAAKWAEVVA